MSTTKHKDGSISSKAMSFGIKPGALEKTEAANYLSLSIDTFARGVQSGHIPKPRQLTSRRVGWLTRELDEWLESRPVSSNLPVANCGKKKGGAA
jgi:prophage regulatory protein